jgi:lipoyl-dependent peroxiredoxin
MALAHILGEAGTPPKKLETGVTVTFKEIEGGWKTGSSQITVKGTVPGIDETTFKKAAEDAKDGCTISNALKGNVELSVEATLA